MTSSGSQSRERAKILRFYKRYGEQATKVVHGIVHHLGLEDERNGLAAKEVPVLEKRLLEGPEV
jgi:hypothetical protein